MPQMATRDGWGRTSKEALAAMHWSQKQNIERSCNDMHICYPNSVTRPLIWSCTQSVQHWYPKQIFKQAGRTALAIMLSDVFNFSSRQAVQHSPRGAVHHYWPGCALNTGIGKCVTLSQMSSRAPSTCAQQRVLWRCMRRTNSDQWHRQCPHLPSQLVKSHIAHAITHCHAIIFLNVFAYFSSWIIAPTHTSTCEISNERSTQDLVFAAQYFDQILGT